MKGLSPKFPLRYNNQFGFYDLNVTYKDMVRQNLKNLLLTNQGERVMDINFGVGIRSYFFEPMTSTVYGRIADNVHGQVAKYMPFVTINHIDFQGGEDLKGTGNVLGVLIRYTIDPLQETDRITIRESAAGI
jgi:phage baseplate assembly protein W|tara:strand:- start:39 stop:434 length:396 start_codon:yes stop_codon:yes gene_type:complete